MVNPLAYLRRGIQALAIKWAGWPVSQTPDVMWNVPQSHAGVEVTEEGSLSLSAVFAAVNLLSQVLGALPLKVYRQQGKDKTEALNDAGYRVLACSPNPEMTPITCRSVMEFHRLLWGNGYGEITWAGNAKVKAIWPVEPWRVRPQREEDGTLFYLIDGKRKVMPDDMLHVPLISYDGVVGRSFVEFAIQSIGLGMATQEFAARYFGNGARPGMILENPGPVNPDARKEFRESWQKSHGGPQNAHKVAVLWGGWTAKPDGSFDPEKSQLLEQRRFSTEEVARWLNIPPHLLRDLSRATFSNIEEQGIDFVVNTMTPICVRWEQEYDRKLFDPPNLHTKHDLRRLMRGNSAARSAYYRELFGIGVFSPNDILRMEDENPIDNGDTHFVPLNMVPLEIAVNPPPEPDPQDPPPGEDKPAKGKNPDAEPAGEEGYSAPVLGMRRLAEHTLRRLAKVEANALRRAASKPSQLLAWMDDFYPAHEARLTEALEPVAEACEAVGVLPLTLASAKASEVCTHSRAALLDLTGTVTASGLAAAITAFTSHLERGACIDAAAAWIGDPNEADAPDPLPRTPLRQRPAHRG